MRFFSFDSALSPEEIKRRCLYLLETEEHSPWNIFREYTSARRGLHLYQQTRILSGILNQENAIDSTLCKE